MPVLARPVLLSALALLAACDGGRERVVGTAGALTRGDCWFDNVGANPAHCAWLRPSRQDAGSGTELPVVILRELPQQPSRRAVIFLNGGPGGDSYLDDEGMPNWRLRRTQLELRHDLVLYDQRGAGRARPDLGCPAQEPALREMLTFTGDYAESSQGLADAIERCLDAVPLPDRRSGLYSTETSVDDLIELMAALQAEHGYESFLLYGVSYGTRLAVQVVQREGVPVDAMVLDSFHPPGIGDRGEYPEDVEALLDAVDRHCRYFGCSGPDGGIRAPLRAAMDSLRDAPLMVKVSDPVGPGERLSVRLHPVDVFHVFQYALFLDGWLPGLPELLDGLADGRFDDDWQRLVDAWVWLVLEPGVNLTTFSLVTCRDDRPTNASALQAQRLLDPMFEDVVEPHAWQADHCQRIAVENQPLSADWSVTIPTLILSMEVDPSTPLHKVEAVLDQFADLSVHVVPGSGHGVIDHDPAAARRAGWFLNGEPMPDDGAGPQMCIPRKEEVPFSA